MLLGSRRAWLTLGWSGHRGHRGQGGNAPSGGKQGVTALCPGIRSLAGRGRQSLRVIEWGFLWPCAQGTPPSWRLLPFVVFGCSCSKTSDGGGAPREPSVFAVKHRKMPRSNRGTPQRRLSGVLAVLACVRVATATAGLPPADPCVPLRAEISYISAQLAERDAELARLRLEVVALRSEAGRFQAGAQRAPSLDSPIRRRQCLGPMLPGQTDLNCPSIVVEKPVDEGPPPPRARTHEPECRAPLTLYGNAHTVKHSRTRMSTTLPHCARASRVSSCALTRSFPQTHACGQTTASAISPARAKQATTPTAVRTRSCPPALPWAQCRIHKPLQTAQRCA
jgi:hypothetical protein